MKIVVAKTCVPFVYGEAEVQAEELVKALQQAGHSVEVVSIPFANHPLEKLLDTLLACRLLAISGPDGAEVDRVIALTFPAYLIAHPNKVIWLIQQYRGAYDLWDIPDNGLRLAENGLQVRSAIYRADQNAFLESRQIYTESRTVSLRLSLYNHLDRPFLYHPPRGAANLYCDTAQDYLFCPSRGAWMKRQELVLQALQWVCQPVKVVFASLSDPEEHGATLQMLAQQLQVSDRAIFLGRMSEAEKIQYYAQARGVVYPPVDEDYGYTPLEAMLSSKPVITCNDSGESVWFVQPGETGWVVEPSPQAIAAAMDELWASPKKAVQLGQQGREYYEKLDIHWSAVVEKLLA